MSTSRPKIFILHENPEWVDTYSVALSALNAEYEFWDLAGGVIDINSEPPLGVFYVRMSASAFGRGNQYAADYARMLVRWLESHDRRVINGSRALSLELSKAEQYLALKSVGVPVPRTVVITGHEGIDAALNQVQQVTAPIIIKPNRGGKGQGVELVSDLSLIKVKLTEKINSSPDGTVLIQEYVKANEPHIVRNEFVGGEFLYSVRVDTRTGFELCPADFCEVGDAADMPMFEILGGFHPPHLAQYQAMIKKHDIEIAGIEIIQDGNGDTFTYDINVNTNYNTLAETNAGYSNTDKAGLNAVCRFLKAELDKLE